MSSSWPKRSAAASRAHGSVRRGRCKPISVQTPVETSSTCESIRSQPMAGRGRVRLPARRSPGIDSAFASAMSSGTPFSTREARERVRGGRGVGRARRRSGVTSSPARSWFQRQLPRHSQRLPTASFAFSEGLTFPSRLPPERWPMLTGKRPWQSGSGRRMPTSHGSRCCTSGQAAKHWGCADGGGRRWSQRRWSMESPQANLPVCRGPLGRS